MNLAPLVAELQKPEYAGLSDPEILAQLNAKTVTIRAPVANWLIKKTAVTAGYWASFVIAAEQVDIQVTVRGLAINVLAWVGDPSGKIETTDMDLPEVRLMLAGIVQAGFVTEGQAAALDALANVSMSWPEFVGLGVIGPGYLENARRLLEQERQQTEQDNEQTEQDNQQTEEEVTDA